MIQILVTGGAGYIGSHTVNELQRRGYQPVVVDNLSNGFRDDTWTHFYKTDVRDEESLRPIFAKHNISHVIHLAGLTIVPESFTKSKEYLEHNLGGTGKILKLCQEFQVKNLIFSSSSTIYGNANAQEKLTEKHKLSSISPYGQSKRMSEEAIKEWAYKTGSNYANLRYFNVAGAARDLTNGQRGHGSQRLIFAATQAALKDKELKIHGDDYPTADGTCVRDYIHVEDIADIHAELIKHMQENACQRTLNCGYGEGFSVKQIVDRFKQVNLAEFKVASAPRREGDPAYLVGDSSELAGLLNWKSRFSEPLDMICRTAFLWEKKRLGLD